MAIGVLDECYNEDEVLSEMLVERDLSKWGGMCALKLAAAAKAKRFLAHPCCQSSLNSLWKSRGMPRVKYWKVRSAQKCQVSLTWPEPVSKLESVCSLPKFVKTFSFFFVSPQNPPEMAKTRWCGNRRELVRKHIVTRGGGWGEILVGSDNLFKVSPHLKYFLQVVLVLLCPLMIFKIFFYDDENPKRKLSLWKKISIFYNAPITKFWSHLVRSGVL